MLRAAAAAWKDYTSTWATYCAAARQAAPQDRTVVVAGPVEELYRLLRHQRK